MSLKDEVWATLDRIAKQQEEFTKELKESREAWDKEMEEERQARKEANAAWNKQMKESNAAWEKEMKEEKRLRKETNKKLEGYISVGSDLLEDLFYRAADKEIDEQGYILIGEVKYDLLDKNVKGRSGALMGQYDLVFYNDLHVLIVEVKRKLRLDDFQQILKHKQTFPLIYLQYQNFQIHLGLASESISPDLLVHAKKEGIYLLQPEEDQITIIAP